MRALAPLVLTAVVAACGVAPGDSAVVSATVTPPAVTQPDTTPTTTGTPVAGTMSETRFWSLVDGSATGDTERQVAAVRRRLEGLSADDLVGYQKRLYAVSNAVLTWRHLAAAEVVLGATSEDAFTDFRTWVIFRGRDVYTAFREDPDSLAAHGPDDDEAVGAAEDLEFLAEELYRERTGRDLGDRPDSPQYRGEPAGERVDDSSYAALARLYPRLAARYLRGVDPVAAPSDGPRPIG